MAIFQALNLYRMTAFNAFVRSFTRVVFAWTLVMAGIMSLAFFIKVGAEFSRVWIASWYVSGLAVLFVERLALSFLAKKWIREGRLYRRAVIVGGGPEAEQLIKALEASADTDIRIVGIFDDRGADRVSPIVAGYPKLGNIDQLVDFARNSRLDLLIVSLPVTAETRLLELLKSCGCCLSISGSRRTPTSCASGRGLIPISATSRSSTSATSPSPTGTSSRSGCSTRSSRRWR
jgi:FlaA1/EpsC-like NDP-sugar epimerase